MPTKKTKKTEQLREKLSREPSRVWDKLSDAEKDEVFRYAEGYRAFLNSGRTERRCVSEFVRLASAKGFVDLDSAGRKKNRLFRVLRGKLLIMAVPGRRPLTDGVRLITSHVDCPRLDLKPNPLYEDTDLALLKTHYYGGVKKYQWVARSLAVVGTVVLGDGRTVDVEIGLKDDEPIFTIPDLLPHFARKQMEKKANEFIPAENLNAVFGGLPYPDKDATDRVKLAVLELLNSRYGITEEDFTSAELQFVPAEPARDSGVDRSLIAGYGQDDRVCAYTSFTGIMEATRPEYAAIAVFYDKEEIGSEGNTGAQSRYLEMFLMDLMELTGTPPTTHNLNKVLMRGKAISADVNAAFDPTYADVFEKRNACRMGYGVTIEKYTGHGGKYMASDAHAEYAGWIRGLFNKHGILWQTGGFGKVDEGGGGTVAKYLAKTGMDIIDVGPPLLGMHSPVEVTAKEDVWMCHRAFAVFFGS
ncbi:MAG: aminopeptidase [Desulfomonile sp.]|nr:aminopeptidase [Desulfomonile sp.]